MSANNEYHNNVYYIRTSTRSYGFETIGEPIVVVMPHSSRYIGITTQLCQ